MNIFFVDKDPEEAAMCLCDKHVVKMVLESAQMLSTAHRVLDGHESIDTSGKRRIKRWFLMDAERDMMLYKATHVNHPCNVWIREGVENYLWLTEHFYYLLNEYKYRYEKTHKCQEMFLTLQNPPFNLQNWDRTPVKLAMPEEFKTDDPVESYRKYYLSKKNDFVMAWTNREPPIWF